ncbi:MAG: hypothetical protein EBT30_09145 [Verrucomicrobia bacterium]|nr:hypothetical protein [Verrucomicrobiota bacterium]
MLYPDKETAAAVTVAAVTATSTTPFAAAAAVRRVVAVEVAALWTKKLQKPVIYCNPETPLLVLNTKGEYIEVLAGDQKGWIINEDWLEIKEIISKAA